MWKFVSIVWLAVATPAFAQDDRGSLNARYASLKRDPQFCRLEIPSVLRIDGACSTVCCAAKGDQ